MLLTHFISRAAVIPSPLIFQAMASKAEGVDSLELIAKSSADRVSARAHLPFNYLIHLVIKTKVSELVNEAARDINFYMQKAPLFDFTILNSSPE